MAGHTPWREIRARKGPETPEDQALGVAIGQAMDDALRIAELREVRSATQAEVAVTLGVSQANVSQLERRTDLYLSTLRDYVEALGGRLMLTAVFPDQTITLAIPTEVAEERQEQPAPAGQRS